MRLAQVDNPPMELFRLPGWRTRPAMLALALAALAVLAVPARVDLKVETLKVETLAEAHTAAQARLDGLIQARREAARRALVATATAKARALGFADLADVPAPNPRAAAAVRTALAQVGKPYRWGATGPASFDCSGLVRFAYADPATIHHVGMYVGQGLMVHAPHTGALVRVDAVRPSGYTGATRPGPVRA